MAKSGAELRQLFLDYFAQHQHKIVASSSMVPKDDPSLLFTNAGMVQFKQLFLGKEKRDYTRAATCQKVFRASGKHNDLENVGRTPRHHTFFEMLGNFSFGDYFKQDAIRFAWQLLTEGYGLDPARLWVSVHETDQEAAKIWETEVGVKPERIVYLGDSENFWSMGDTGPCGPCSEIHIDQGPEVGCGHADCAVGCDCDRYLELWNLVFMQFNRDASGEMTPLPKPSIDTGMGLERISAVCQGKLSNYDSDLFTPILDYAAQMAGIGRGDDDEQDVSLRVIADHARACAFLIGDGVMPSNEGRGYVLRRILRRAARHGRKLGLVKPFLHEVSQQVIAQMQGPYPSLYEHRSFVDRVIIAEEERFNETLDTGLKFLEEAMQNAKAKGRKSLEGGLAFKLYDTYGFPLDLTQIIAQEEGLGVDEPGFDEAMGQQKSRSRAAWKGSGEQSLAEPLAALRAEGFTTTFIGYDGLEGTSPAKLIMVDGQAVEAVGQGQKAELVTPATPFYGEAGGQMGDTGWIKGPRGTAQVTDCKKPGGQVIVHHITVTEGQIAQGEELILTVDPVTRDATRANHTATHLLHRALRNVLGEHVKQAGSLVSSERLRFDFSHFEAVTQAELAEVERQVNAGIRQNVALCTTEMGIEEAMKSGATALFEERYGDKVRVVAIPGITSELCGGTHARSTGDIGLCKIVGESSVAAGVRRLEALTGAAAVEAMQALEAQLAQAAATLKSAKSEVAERAAKLVQDLKDKDREIGGLKAKLAGAGGGRDLLSEVVEIKGVCLLAAQVETDNAGALREASDNLIGRLQSGVLVLGAAAGDKALLLARVSPDLAGRVHAGNLIKELAPMVGGGGGGRPDMAQAGGKDPNGLEAALARAAELVAAQLG